MPGPIAIILAGGANRRFWPLTQKSLLPFGELTLLERHVAALAGAGFADVIVVANPENEGRMRAIAAATAVARVHVVVQPTPLGMGDAVLCCEPLLLADLRGRPALVTQVHDLVDPDLFGRLVAGLTADDADALVVGVRLDRYFPGGYLSLRDGRAIEVVEKPPPGSEPSNLIKIVDDLVRQPNDLIAALRAVDPNPSDQYERALGQLMATGVVRVVEYEGPWVPIKYPWDVLKATEFLLGRLADEIDAADGVQRGSDVTIHPHATVVGPVVLGDGVRVFAGGAIVGPAIVGAGTIVGSGALVRGSVIGQRCVVGFAAEIARSYVGDGCELHTNYVGDSVIGDDVSFGSGTVTANLRLDERDLRLTVDGQRIDTGMPKLGALIGSRVRIGINASLMPGVRIGSSCAVGPGVVLARDLPDGHMALAKQTIEVAPNPIEIDGASRQRFRKKLR